MNTPWTWNIGQQQAFQALKNTFSQEPILAMWDPDRPTHLEVDASWYAMGGVLLQKLEDNLWHPIAILSQSMIEAEQNYEIYNKEMLAIVRALEDWWWHYLKSLPQIFNIISDHRNLEYRHTAQNLLAVKCDGPYILVFSIFVSLTSPELLTLRQIPSLIFQPT
jgi:hypothetical protein